MSSFPIQKYPPIPDQTMVQKRFPAGNEINSAEKSAASELLVAAGPDSGRGESLSPKRLSSSGSAASELSGAVGPDRSSSAETSAASDNSRAAKKSSDNKQGIDERRILFFRREAGKSDPSFIKMIVSIIEDRKKNADSKTKEQLEEIKSKVVEKYDREHIDTRDVVGQINKLTIKSEAL